MEEKRIDTEPPLTASIINAASRSIGSCLSVPRPGFPVQHQSRSLARKILFKGLDGVKAEQSKVLRKHSRESVVSLIRRKNEAWWCHIFGE